METRQSVGLILRAGAAVAIVLAIWLFYSTSERPRTSLHSTPEVEPRVPSPTSQERAPPSAAAEGEGRLPVSGATPSHESVPDRLAPTIDALEVLVLDDFSGLPVSSARVRAAPLYGSAGAVEGTTDSSGRAELVPTSEGPLVVEGWHAGTYAESQGIYSGQSVLLRLHARPQTTIRVLDEVGNGLADVVVRFVPEGSEWVAGRTDSEGYSPRFHVHPDSRLLELLGRDFARVRLAVPREPIPDPWEITVMRRPIEVVCLVRHSDLPVEGAIVWDHSLAEIYARSDRDGRAILGRHDPGRELLIRVTHPDFLPTMVPYVVSEHQPEVVVDLPAGRTLSVLVVDANQQPVSEVQVSATWATGWARDLRSPADSFTNFQERRTDEGGRCTLRGLPQGKFSLRARHPDFALKELVGGDSDSIVLTLDPRLDTRLRIRLPPELERFLGLVAWSVHCQKRLDYDAGWGLGRSSSTDGSGVARLRQLEAGNYLFGLECGRRLWSENFYVSYEGLDLVHEGPSALVELEVEPGMEGPFLLEGESYQSRFAPWNGAWAAAARPGPARLRAGSTSWRVFIEGSAEPQYIRLTALVREEAGADPEAHEEE